MLDIYHHPGHLIRRLHQISLSLFAEHMHGAGHDLTTVQYAALEAIDKFPGIDQATLAGMIAYDRATIGGVVDRLLQKDLIHREVSETDRRARILQLTDDGRRVLETVRPIVLDAQNHVLSGLDAEERAVFLTLARKAVDIGNSFTRVPQIHPSAIE